MGKFVDLATKILEQCKALEENTDSKVVTQWSEFPEAQLTGPAIMAKVAVQSALLELSVMMKTATETITSLGMNTATLVAFQALYRFNIAEKVPTEHDASYEDVANACGLPEQDLRRVVRYLMTWNIFIEPRPNRVAHNGPSRAFRENKLLQQTVGMCTEEMWLSAANHINALVKWPGSKETNQCGSGIAHSTETDFFQEVSKYPDRAKRFGDAMTFMGRMPGLGMEPVVGAYNWDALGEVTIVDVGGSHGELARRLLLKYPKLSFVVQDLSSTIDEARQLPSQPRLSFMTHNFFDEQPLQADVYMFRWILHDWPDKHCVEILQNLRKSLKQGARVLIMEFCISEPGQAPRVVEEAQRRFDLAMWSLNNAKERSEEEWNTLIKQADTRFNLEKVIKVPGSLLSILDIKWDS